GLMQSGQAATGMQTMNQAILKAIREGLITVEDGLKASPEVHELQRLLNIRM
ncbi:MAG TPA: type IV pili twitching motility protein PilT, partial [Persephonella sp.]|nr:type IV pili twitching motility protein PilT [Persephonella sp.]